MKKKNALKIILIIAIAGMLFSGYLSWEELTRGVCPMGGCPSIVAIPACVYGFVMYTVVLIIAIAGLKSKEQ